MSELQEKSTTQSPTAFSEGYWIFWKLAIGFIGITVAAHSFDFFMEDGLPIILKWLNHYHTYLSSVLSSVKPLSGFDLTMILGVLLFVVYKKSPQFRGSIQQGRNNFWRMARIPFIRLKARAIKR